MRDEMHDLTGHEVVDVDGDKIGKVADVIYATATEEPAYVRLDVGMLKNHHVLVPLDAAYRSEAGDLVVPYSKDLVKHAPKVDMPVALTTHLEQDLQQYYATPSAT